MGVERVDCYSDDEYQQALQMEEWQQQEWLRQEQAELEYLQSQCPKCEKMMYECVCQPESPSEVTTDEDLPF